MAEYYAQVTDDPEAQRVRVGERLAPVSRGEVCQGEREQLALDVADLADTDAIREEERKAQRGGDCLARGSADKELRG
ncbi:MAG TPA: hypothetical protein ENJ18_03135 [Nannocystis exedens]|nr:hypothetical protein [Nannocystis exedens]